MEQYCIVTDYEEMLEQEYVEYADEYPDELSEDNDEYVYEFEMVR